MKLLFRQRIFSWFDSYDIYDEWGNTVYTVRGQLSWGHLLKIYDARGYAVGTVRERVLTFLQKFEMYLGERYMGCVRFSIWTATAGRWRATGSNGIMTSVLRAARGWLRYPNSFSVGPIPM